jgi:NAD(P)-dependent dehydrogenase (short-subunit alcohol dehydrogenase family)
VTIAGVDVLVTGASRGLGRAVAEAFAAEGARVWICADHVAELERTKSLIDEAGGVACAITADLADPDECMSVAHTVSQGASRLQVVVNAAAVLQLRRVENLSVADWSHTLAVNLTAPFILTRELLAPLQTTGGSVINVSSRAGVKPFEQEAAYCASKYGVEALTGCLAIELRGAPVSVNTITPGLRIKPTSMTDEDVLSVPEPLRKQWSDPAEIMPAFVFLAGLRGEVTGRRFDAFVLTQALERLGIDGVLAKIDEIAE